MVETCLREWGLESVYCLTLDNASTNDVLVRCLGNTLNNWETSVLGAEHLHMRCAAHIVNLVVTEGLKENLVSVNRVRAACKYFLRSPSRWISFKEAAVLEKITYKKHLWLDSPTRWNGAFLMLDRAVQYEKAFERSELADGHGVPDENDWKNVKRLVKFLDHFCHLTKKVSGSWYLTSNLLLPEINDLYVLLKKYEADSDESIRQMATRMLGKFDKYWRDMGKVNMKI